MSIPAETPLITQMISPSAAPLLSANIFGSSVIL